MRFIVCYDITNQRRGQKVHRLMQNYALPLQESVFIFVGDQRKFEQMKADLLAIVNLNTDDVRIYPLGHNAKVWEWDKTDRLDGLFLAI